MPLGYPGPFVARCLHLVYLLAHHLLRLPLWYRHQGFGTVFRLVCMIKYINPKKIRYEDAEFEKEKHRCIDDQRI